MPPRAPDQQNRIEQLGKDLSAQMRALEQQLARLTTLVEVSASKYEPLIAGQAEHERRISALEGDRKRAEGAAIASRAIAGAVVGLVGLLGTLGGWWMAHERAAPAPQVQAASTVPDR